MGNTFVEASDPLDDKALKARLIEEVRRRNLPFGIHVLAADSGETATKALSLAQTTSCGSSPVATVAVTWAVTRS